LAATVPDAIVKLFEILLYEGQRLARRVSMLHFEPVAFMLKGRAEVLETSISGALKHACQEALEKENFDRIPACQENPLDRAFNDHWDATGAAPALILNTTWAETGARIAYAPFSLKDVGDETLKSVSDLEVSSGEAGNQVKLIRAAIAS